MAILSKLFRSKDKNEPVKWEQLPVYYSPMVLKHLTGPTHPERPARIKVMVEALQNSAYADRLKWREPRVAKTSDLRLAHTPEYIDMVAAMAVKGGGFLDADTPVSSGSFLAATLSAGGWLDAVDYAINNNAPALVLTRPPGHHAEKDRGQGFCLFSNAAIAARYAVVRLNLEHVAVVDWDVHHGNGTQHILENDQRFTYISLHQYPHYPGTGAASEKGAYGNVLNLPMPAGAGSKKYHRAFKKRILPALELLHPDLILISAGFDAHRDDPLGDINLESEDYFLFTRWLLNITPRLVIGLEGGYNLEALSASILEVVKALLE